MDEKELLLKIYIGQGVNYWRGILYEFRDKLYFSDEENNIIDSLLKKELIKKVDAYSSVSIKTLVTTKPGTELSKKIIQEMLDKDSNLTEELNQIPRKVLGFLLINCVKSQQSVYKVRYFFDFLHKAKKGERLRYHLLYMTLE